MTSDSGETGAAVRTVLCLASYEKGHEFVRECKRLGWQTILVTVAALQDANWPRESIDELFCMPDLANRDDVLKGVAYLARTHNIERIIALDDYDVETAGVLRDHLRLPGMGVSRSKLVRDKLAMRVRAREAGILVPDFTPVLNYDAIRAFMERVPPPWVLKPRAEASTVGIEKIESAEVLWPQLDLLGDRQSFYVLERYVPGDVYHVDSLTRDGEVIFSEAHGYARPPLDVYHSGGIAVTRTLPRESEDAQALDALNRLVLAALELQCGASHMEFIRGHEDGRFYFLEVGARVGGANIAELVDASTGINLWREWARLELSDQPRTYTLPERRYNYAGVIVTLARQEHPDTAGYTDPEIVWCMQKHHHVGFVLASSDHARVEDLLQSYSQRFAEDFFATLPAATDLTLLRSTPKTNEG